MSLARLYLKWSQINFSRRGATFSPCSGAQRSAYKQAWACGYATEACTAVLDWFTGALPGELVVLYTQTANVRSMRLAAKLGFTELERFEAYGAEQWFGWGLRSRRSFELVLDGADLRGHRSVVDLGPRTSRSTPEGMCTVMGSSDGWLHKIPGWQSAATFCKDRGWPSATSAVRTTMS